MNQSQVFIRRLKELAGEDAARQLCDEFSGDLIQIRSITPPPIYIPKERRVSEAHKLAAFNAANAAALIEEFGISDEAVHRLQHRIGRAAAQSSANSPVYAKNPAESLALVQLVRTAVQAAFLKLRASWRKLLAHRKNQP